MSEQWWGFSVQHGWVLLDRRIPCNQPGSTEDLMFLRCKDSTVFRASKKLWNAPSFIFAPIYIGSLPTRDKLAAESEFASIKCRSDEFTAKLFAIHTEAQEAIATARAAEISERNKARLERQRAQFERSRTRFFENLGMDNPGMKSAGSGRYHRITHCYTCKYPLDNSMDSECLACGWIVCSCGACGCGYQNLS